MRALICNEPGRLALIDRPAPGAVAPDQVRLSISHVGICGTDYHIFEGKHPFLGIIWTALLGATAVPQVCDAEPGVVTHFELGVVRPQGLVR